MTPDNLIFIVSQPRSGSTLLQSLLSNNHKVNTISEPWILLPFLNIFNKNLVDAKYNQKLALDIIFDFIEKTDSLGSFHNRLRNFLLDMYQPLLSDGIQYIIDKTPRYYHILPTIKSFFPESKIILLKRNPLAVLSSITDTWGDTGSISDLAPYYEDIMSAPILIQNFLDTSKDNKTQIREIFYEDLVNQPEKTIKLLYEWLGIAYSSDILDYSSNDKYLGIMGDPIGVQQKSMPDNVSVDSWKDKLKNPYWSEFYRGYVNAVGEDFLERFGYQLDFKGSSSDLFNQYQSQNKILNYKRIIQRKENQINSLIQIIHGYKNSFSWRLTRPVRWLFGMFKNKSRK